MWTFWYSKEATEREKAKVGESYLRHREKTDDHTELIRLIRMGVGHGLMNITRLLKMWLDDQQKQENQITE